MNGLQLQTTYDLTMINNERRW